MPLCDLQSSPTEPLGKDHRERAREALVAASPPRASVAAPRLGTFQRPEGAVRDGACVPCAHQVTTVRRNARATACETLPRSMRASEQSGRRPTKTVS
jgi:hypothetical protein